MLNWSQTRLLAMSGAAVAIVMEPISWLTSGISPCIVNPENYSLYYAGGDKCPTFHVFLFKLLASIFEKLGDPNWVIATFTIVLAGSTIGLWISTNKLWNAGEKQFALAEDTAQRQIRAYVHVKDFRRAQRYLPNIRTGFGVEQPEIVVTWENTGESPTVNARSNINWVTFTGSIPDNFDFSDDPDREPFSAVIGPRQTHELILTAVPPTTLKLVAMKKLKLYVWGWIDYNDVFADTPRRRTEFCSAIQLFGNPEETGCVMSLRTHVRHNGADDTCEKKPRTSY
jgi:hypothetical protein